MKNLEVKVQFFDKHKGGRNVPPNLSDGVYRPHFVVSDCSNSEYLGIQFIPIEGIEVAFNQEIITTVKLLFDGVDYSPLNKGTYFYIMEGSRKVGTGCVL